MAAATAHAQPPPVLAVKPAALMGLAGKGASPLGGKKLGTLVVVVYRARNLPNKQRIGKQDPYCTVVVGHQKQRTEAIKRGGQTPRWDAQLEFEIWQESEDQVSAVTTETGGIAPTTTTATPTQAPPSTATTTSRASGTSSSLATANVDLPGVATVGRTKSKSSDPASAAGSGTSSNKRLMKVACYADDAREPELIGEAVIDFADTLKKGEFDEWVSLKDTKGKYAGEIFFEMTFYSAAPPPVRRPRKKPDPAAGYGGPGTFEPLPDTHPATFTAPAAPSISSNSAVTSHLYSSRPETLNNTGSHPPNSASTPALRASASHHTLSVSSAAAGGFSDFSSNTSGYRPPLPSASPGFPMLEHDRIGAYTPPYAPSSLVHSTSSGNLRPHRASMSSIGLTQHDMDALLRPMSSLSVSSVNKPLPLPDGSAGSTGIAYAGTSAMPHSLSTSTIGPGRAHSGSPAVFPEPHYHQKDPYSSSHTLAQSYQTTSQASLPNPYAAQPQHVHPPYDSSDPRPDIHVNPHRHSMSTYLPPGSDGYPYHAHSSGPPPPPPPPAEQHSQYPVAQHPPPQQPYGNQLTRPISSNAAGSGSWADPRSTSPLPVPPRSPSTPNHDQSYHHRQTSAGAPTSPRLPGSPHPPALQPGLLSPASPGRIFPIPTSPPPSSIAATITPPVAHVQRMPSPGLPPSTPLQQGDASYRHGGPQYGHSSYPPAEHDQYASKSRSQFVESPQPYQGPPDHDYRQPSPAPPLSQTAAQYPAYDTQDYSRPDPSQQSTGSYTVSETQYQQHQRYGAQPYHQDPQSSSEQPYYEGQQNGHQQQQPSSYPPPPPSSTHDPRYGLSPAPSTYPPAEHGNTDYRTTSPYRPLPQPTPEPYGRYQHQESVPSRWQSNAHKYYANDPSPSGYAQQTHPPPPHLPPPQQQSSYPYSHDHQAAPPSQSYQQHYQESAPLPPPTPSQTYSSQHSSAPSGTYQPRFGLPPHQPYDPPYVGAQPPPVPPVPHELRQEQLHNPGHAPYY